MKEDRLFVEWYDADRPGWGGYVTTLDSHFLQVFADMVANYGPPTRVEFRRDGEGWTSDPGAKFCSDCGADDPTHLFVYQSPNRPEPLCEPCSRAYTAIDIKLAG